MNSPNLFGVATSCSSPMTVERAGSEGTLAPSATFVGLVFDTLSAAIRSPCCGR